MGSHVPLPPRRTTPAARRVLPACLALGLGAGGLGAGGLARCSLLGSVPAGFTPVDVVLCQPQPGPTSIPTSSPTSSHAVNPDADIREVHPGGGHAALVAALSEPDDRRKGVSCTSERVGIPGLRLMGSSGKAMHVMRPPDVCSGPNPATAKAPAALKIASSRQREIPVAP